MSLLIFFYVPNNTFSQAFKPERKMIMSYINCAYASALNKLTKNTGIRAGDIYLMGVHRNKTQKKKTSKKKDGDSSLHTEMAISKIMETGKVL